MRNMIFLVFVDELQFYDHANARVFDILLNYYLLCLFICD